MSTESSAIAELCEADAANAPASLPPVSSSSPSSPASSSPAPCADTLRERLEGAWTVARAAELHERARSWADADADVVIACEALDKIDGATLQLLVALRRALAARGHSLHLDGLAAPLAELIALSGLAGELLR